MSAIGGFLPLEVAPNRFESCGEPYHAGAAALSSGRGCWHLILRTCRPARVLLPFYICDAVVRPLTATGTPFEFYPIDRAFQPMLNRAPLEGELLLVVNYFGVQTAVVTAAAERHADRVVVDDTQAFFHRGRSDAWSFNSARKFFGVPDGAFLYGPANADQLPPSDIADCDHLRMRLAGRDGEAWEQFKQHEARIGIEPRAMSPITSGLLAAVDMTEARRRRDENFAALHVRLGALNTIALALDDVAGGGPMSYPFLPASDVDRGALARRGVYVPTLWPEIESRPDRGFAWERRMARRLLPLPIDHRYAADDMDMLARTLLQVLR
jgi:hypothetical protein